MYWYNGKLINSQILELDVNEPGLLYGATIFTTLRVYGNSLDHKLTHWRSHCERLKSSLQAFNWQSPNWDLVAEGTQLMKTEFPILRITLFPNGREWITGRLLPTDLLQKQKYGIICAVSAPELNRVLPHHKTGNYLSAWLAKTSSDGQETILVDQNHNWLETTTGNLWGWGDNCWWTPPLNAGILPGIVRAKLIKWLLQEQQVVQERPWTAELVQNLEAIAYTNSVVEIIPIHTVKEAARSLEYNPYHPSFQQLRRFFLP